MGIQIKANCVGEWILKHQNDEKLPTAFLAEELGERFAGIKIIDLNLLQLVVETDEDDIRELADVIKVIVSGQYGVTMNEESTGEDRLVLSQEGSLSIELMEVTIEKKTALIMKQVNEMVGWERYKELCEEIVLVTPQIHTYRTNACFQFQNFLFGVNDGCGLTTALENLAKVMEAAELFSFQAGKPKTMELTLSTKTEDGKYSLSDTVRLLADENNICKVVCFDISEYMERSRQNDLKRFLTQLVEMEEFYMFAFRIPYVEPEAMENMREVLADVLFVRSIPVAPFSNEQLKECARRKLNSYGFEEDDMVWEVFFSRIREEKHDGRFYGVQSVNKIVYEMLWLKHKADAKRMVNVVKEENIENEDNTAAMIRMEEILELSPLYNVSPKTGFDELSEMIGMEGIAQRLREIVAQVKLTMENKRMERPCLHMRFVGSPGTGKTTVARIVGKIFAENSILSNGYFFEYTARDLCGEYVGQTAPRTSSICRDAYGSILFIDEAYALYNGDDRNTDYGREALTTLVSEMENHRSDMVVVMAGYKDDMNKLMEGNAGLRSRMPFLLEFPNYTREQLLEIFLQMAHKAWQCDDSFDTEAKTYFLSLTKEFMESKEFSNARFARNLYERTWSKAAGRAQLHGNKEIRLSGDDIRAALAEKEFSEKIAQKPVIGFTAR